MIPYHPNFFAPSGRVQRHHCEQRLAKILPFVSGSVLDIGCSEGYFSFGVAGQADYVQGIDHHQRNIDTCRRYQEKRASNVIFERADLERYIQSSRAWDTTLYLSVHHHVRGCNGVDKAAEILARILSITRGNLLFDIGQKNEVHTTNNWWKGLPDGDPDEWVRGLLEDAGAKVIDKLGAFEFAGAMRGLWVASR